MVSGISPETQPPGYLPSPTRMDFHDSTPLLDHGNKNHGKAEQLEALLKEMGGCLIASLAASTPLFWPTPPIAFLEMPLWLFWPTARVCQIRNSRGRCIGESIWICSGSDPRLSLIMRTI